MKLGISNLAWNGEENLEKLLPVFRENCIETVEIVLAKYIDWELLDVSRVLNVIRYLQDSGLDVTSTQSIFFNSNVSSFGGKEFSQHLEKVSRVCYELGISRIVLGAPGMRTLESCLELGNQFAHIDGILSNNNQTLLLEPNSRLYGGHYFYTVGEIVSFLDTYSFTNIETMVDTHNCILEGDDPAEVYTKYLSRIAHIHISEINLGDIISSDTHRGLANALKNTEYSGLVVYEAKPSTNLITSIELFNKLYNI